MALLSDNKPCSDTKSSLIASSLQCYLLQLLPVDLNQIVGINCKLKQQGKLSLPAAQGKQTFLVWIFTEITNRGYEGVLLFYQGESQEKLINFHLSYGF